MTAQEMIATARRTNAERDAVDIEHGFAPPHRCPTDLHAKTIMQALEAAITTKDWDSVAEAYVMTEQLVERMPRTLTTREENG